MSTDPSDTDPAAQASPRAPAPDLLRWGDEGGAAPATGAAEASPPGVAEAHLLRIRVIALENLLIALLADATDHQRMLAPEMGDFISPRPGFTPHPLTLRAAEAMRSLLGRADRFRPGTLV